MAPVKSIGTDHIDYFPGESASRLGLTEGCFGIRVEEGRYWAVVKISDGQPFTFGKCYPLPVRIDSLPNHFRRIVEDHLLNCPSSDLAEVLDGRKSFREALDSPTTIEPKRMSASST
jgi:hypothetical protein